MSKEQIRYRAILTDVIEGKTHTEFHCDTKDGKHVVIELGINQVLSTKRGADRVVANYEVQEKKFK